MDWVGTMGETARDTQGFTLMELSIVLVIIGLIVGGVLVGQDLIRGAEIRATVGQVEKFNASVNTFRSKFNGVPGDLKAADAAALGLFAETGGAAGAVGHQDGNGVLDGGSAGSVAGIGETIEFWRHLADANLIDGSYGVTGNSAIAAGTGQAGGNVTVIGQTLPPAKLGRDNYLAAFSAGGLNYYQFAPITGLTADTGAYGFGAYGMSPVESYNVDAKIDDGMPNAGQVVARGIAALNAAPSVNAASTASTCTIGSGIGTDTYNRVAATGGTDPSCSLRVRFN